MATASATSVPVEGHADNTPAASVRPQAMRRSEIGVLVLIVAAELVLTLLHVGKGLGLLPVLLVHAAIVAAAVQVLIVRRPPAGDATAAVLIVLAVAVAGPVGALAGWFFAAAARPPAATSPLLGAWYRRIALSAEIDPVTELCDNVASGRTMNLAAPPPLSFLAVMTSGAMADKQTALGLIARRFHPDYLPALVKALKNPEPVVRVQAAAVVARIRDQLSALVRQRIEELEAASAGAAPAAAISELEKAVASGLLDEAERRRAEAQLARHAAGGVAAHAAGASRRPDRAMLQAHLDGRRFKEFRVARRIDRIGGLGHYRVRPLRLARRAALRRARRAVGRA